MKAADSASEQQRANNLRSYSILDTGPEEVFDDLAALAARICETPIALISFLDASREWIKSKVGTDAVEISRDVSFCAYTVAEPDALVVTNARTDHRFAGNPLVKSALFIGFYAGVPLISPEGFPLGCLCVIDRQPRDIQRAELESLKILARQAVRELVTRRVDLEQKNIIDELQRAKEALSEAQDMVEHSRNIIQILDMDGRLTYVNRSWCDALGYDANDALKLTIWDVLDATSLQPFKDVLRRMALGEKIDRIEMQLTGKGGRRLAVEGSITCKFDQGEPTAIRCIVRDVTSANFEQEWRREAEQQYTRLFHDALEGVVQIAPDGNLISANPSMARILGYDSPEDLIQCHNERGYPLYADKAERLKLILTLQRRGRIRGYECRLFRKDRSIVWVRGSGWAVPGPGQSPLFFEGVISDITEEKRFNMELEQRNRQIEQANQLKSAFLANMSHELRTPLNSVIGFAELMQDGGAGPVSDQQKDFLGDILGSARHLLHLINDILDISKIEAGKMEFRPETVDLFALVSEVTSIVQPQAVAKRLSIAVDVDDAVTRVFLDPSKLRQVLFNYVSNAVKFTPPGGKIWISVRAEDEQWFRLEVADSGTGIDPNDIPRLFAEFQQLDQTASKEHQGTGLGLALTKRLVESQGGRVGVHSVKGDGSNFYAILPRRSAGISGVDLSHRESSLK